MLRILATASALVALLVQGGVAKAPARRKPGEAAPDFSVKTLDGKARSVADLREEKKPKILAVVFWSPTCPWSRATAPELAKIAKDFEGKNVRVVLVDPNDPGNKDAEGRTDDPKDVARYLKEQSIPLEAYVDSDQRAADLLGAQTTPDVFVVGVDGKIAYTGRVNDLQNPAKPGEWKRGYLRAALEALIANKTVAESSTATGGFGIRRAKKG